MQRIAWGRGFFRAWLALSVIWIGACVSLIEPKTYRTLWQSVYEVKSKDAEGKDKLDYGKYILVWRKSADNKKETILDMSNASPAPRLK